MSSQLQDILSSKIYRLLESQQSIKALGVFDAMISYPSVKIMVEVKCRGIVVIPLRPVRMPLRRISGYSHCECLRMLPRDYCNRYSCLKLMKIEQNVCGDSMRVRICALLTSYNRYQCA